MSQINLLNHNVGIQQILDSPAERHIPTARSLASTQTNEIGLSEHFTMSNMDKNLESLLMPDLGDGQAMIPENFNRTIRDLPQFFEQEYAGEMSPAIKTMLNEVIKPLGENKDLLSSYSLLMVGA